MERKFLIYALLYTVVVTGALFLFVNFNAVQIYPFGEDYKHLQIDTYHENVPREYSSVFAREENSSIILDYSLTTDTTIPEPFVAVNLSNRDTNEFIDLSSFHKINVTLKAQKAKRIPIIFTLDIDGFTSPDKELSSLPFTKVIDYEGEKEYQIDFNDFEIPSWWLREHHFTKDSIKELDFSRVNYIIVGSGQAMERGVKDQIVVSSITFTSDNTSKYYLFLVVIVVGYVVFLIIYLTKKKRVYVPIVATYSEEDDAEKVSRIDQITNYIAHHYSNEELSVKELQMELGISSREIGALIKKHYTASFKSYLNGIRMTEVKRLLKETDLPISEIAYRTGYSNVTHFNRVFKNEFGLTPKDYREKN